MERAEQRRWQDDTQVPYCMVAGHVTAGERDSIKGRFEIHVILQIRKLVMWLFCTTTVPLKKTLYNVLTTHHSRVSVNESQWWQRICGSGGRSGPMPSRGRMSRTCRYPSDTADGRVLDWGIRGRLRTDPGSVRHTSLRHRTLCRRESSLTCWWGSVQQTREIKNWPWSCWNRKKGEEKLTGLLVCVTGVELRSTQAGWTGWREPPGVSK